MPHGQPTATVEDYLLAIYGVASEGRPIIAARLAERLEVAPPTVGATLQRMKRDGLISDDDRRGIKLTDRGWQNAESIVRRHRLAERMLTDLLGLPWHEAHEEAHRFEHAISDRVERRLMEILGHPTTCPHGSPIPGTGAVIEPGLVGLDTCAEGETVTVAMISEEAEQDPRLLEFLERSGLVPGAELTVQAVAPYNGLVTVLLRGERIPIGLQTAAQIQVRPHPRPSSTEADA